MASKVQEILERAAREPTFARSIIRDPRGALRSYNLTTEEFNRVLDAARRSAVPPPG